MNQTFSRKTSFGYRFAMIHRSHTALTKEGMLALGITTAQLPFLAELFYRNEPFTQDQLSKAVCIDPAATARTLDQLEKKGLVSRKVNPKDRRQKLVAATPLAQEMKEDFYAVLRKTSDTLVDGLSEEGKEAALGLLDRIMANGMKAKYTKG